MMNKEIVVYFFKEGTKESVQNSKVVPCNDIIAATLLFDKEVKKIQCEETKWTYIDITDNGHCIKNFKK